MSLRTLTLPLTTSHLRKIWERNQIPHLWKSQRSPMRLNVQVMIRLTRMNLHHNLLHQTSSPSLQRILRTLITLK